MRQHKYQYWYSGKMLEVGQIEFFTDDSYRVNDELVGGILREWTGLKDKNGVDIYESDEMFDGNRHGEIKWIIENARFCLVGNDFAIEMFDLKNKNFEVFGNIYQNPELLQ